MTLRLNGSTSGYVEIDAPATAGSNTLVLPNGNGTNGQYLKTNGSGGLSWAGAGKILQVVENFHTTSVAYTSTTTWTSSGLSASITPSSASSKVLVFVSAQIGLYRSGGGGVGTGFRIERNSTAILTTNSNYAHYLEASASVGLYLITKVPLRVLDSPATTSSITYTLFGQNYSAGTSTFQDGDSSRITLMEVAA